MEIQIRHSIQNPIISLGSSGSKSSIAQNKPKTHKVRKKVQIVKGIPSSSHYNGLRLSEVQHLNRQDSNKKLLPNGSFVKLPDTSRPYLNRSEILQQDQIKFRSVRFETSVNQSMDISTGNSVLRPKINRRYLPPDIQNLQQYPFKNSILSPVTAQRAQNFSSIVSSGSQSLRKVKNIYDRPSIIKKKSNKFSQDQMGRFDTLGSRQAIFNDLLIPTSPSNSSILPPITLSTRPIKNFSGLSPSKSRQLLIDQHFSHREEAIRPTFKDMEKNTFLDTQFGNLYASLNANETQTMKMFISESKALKQQFLLENIKTTRDKEKAKMRSQMDIVIQSADTDKSELFRFQVSGEPAHMKQKSGKFSNEEKKRQNKEIKSGQFNFAESPAGLPRKSSLGHDPRDRRTESGRLLLENTNDTTQDEEKKIVEKAILTELNDPIIEPFLYNSLDASIQSQITNQQPNQTKQVKKTLRKTRNQEPLRIQKKDVLFDEENFTKTIESLRGENTGAGKSFNERLVIKQSIEQKYKEAVEYQERMKELKQDIKLNRNLSQKSKKMEKLQDQNQRKDTVRAQALRELQEKLKNSQVFQYEDEGMKGPSVRQSTDRIKSLVHKNKSKIDKKTRCLFDDEFQRNGSN